MAEKAGVAKRGEGDLLGGIPYRVSGSAQATKDQVSKQNKGVIGFWALSRAVSGVLWGCWGVGDQGFGGGG